MQLQDSYRRCRYQGNPERSQSPCQGTSQNLGIPSNPKFRHHQSLGPQNLVGRRRLRQGCPPTNLVCLSAHQIVRTSHFSSSKRYKGQKRQISGWLANSGVGSIHSAGQKHSSAQASSSVDACRQWPRQPVAEARRPSETTDRYPKQEKKTFRPGLASRGQGRRGKRHDTARKRRRLSQSETNRQRRSQNLSCPDAKRGISRMNTLKCTGSNV